MQEEASASSDSHGLPESKALEGLLGNSTLCRNISPDSSIMLPLDGVVVLPPSCSGFTPHPSVPGTYQQVCENAEMRVFARLLVSKCQPSMAVTEKYQETLGKLTPAIHDSVFTIIVSSQKGSEQQLSAHVEYLSIFNTFRIPGSPPSYLINHEAIRQLLDRLGTNQVESFISTNHAVANWIGQLGLSETDELKVRAVFYSLVTHRCLPLLFANSAEETWNCQMSVLARLLKGKDEKSEQVSPRMLMGNALSEMDRYVKLLWMERLYNAVHNVATLPWIGFLYLF